VWSAAYDDLEAAKEMASADPEFAAEIPALEEVVESATEKLRRILIPRDPDDARDVILEVKSGEGGEESALFAGDLLKMYLKYAETKGWKTEVLEANQTDIVENVEPADLEVHLSTTGQIHRQIADLPEGTPIPQIRIDDP
jgi:peptide chain release factor 1